MFRKVFGSVYIFAQFLAKNEVYFYHNWASNHRKMDLNPIPKSKSIKFYEILVIWIYFGVTKSSPSFLNFMLLFTYWVGLKV